MLFYHRFEIFGAGRFSGVGLHEVLHGFFESLIARTIVVHHHPDHVQDVRPLGIDQAPCCIKPGPGIARAVSHRERACINRPITLRIFLQHQLTLVIPEFEELFGILLDNAQIQ